LKKRIKSVFLRSVSFFEEVVRHPHQLVRILKDFLVFRQAGGVVSGFWPVLRDFDDQAGTARGHYFHQDLLVASYVHEKKPRRHIDVGSRVDGFVAHVAAFRQIEIVDVRPFASSPHKHIRFVQRDMMADLVPTIPTADSISCLHAIEHFGLGRYGETIDPEGHLRGFTNLVRMLEPGGHLYISFPISRQNGVFFNAHRVFHPKDILSWPGCEDSLTLMRFDYVDDEGDLHLDLDLLRSQLALNYGCGIYTFTKIR
jgi:hypothetical protein